MSHVKKESYYFFFFFPKAVKKKIQSIKFPKSRNDPSLPHLLAAYVNEYHCFFFVHKHSANFLLIKKIHSASSNTSTSLYSQQCSIETLIKFDPTGRRKQTLALFRSERHHPSHFSEASSMASIWESNVSCAGRLVKGRWVNRLFLAVTYSLYRICTDSEIRVRSVGHVWLYSSSSFRIFPTHRKESMTCRFY